MPHSCGTTGHARCAIESRGIVRRVVWPVLYSQFTLDGVSLSKFALSMLAPLSGRVPSSFGLIVESTVVPRSVKLSRSHRPWAFESYLTRILTSLTHLGVFAVLSATSKGRPVDPLVEPGTVTCTRQPTQSQQPQL